MSARRDWYSVTCRLFRLPKFRRLTDDAQLALFYVWGIAGDETPEATWRTADDLVLALQVHGRNPVTLGDTIEELRAGGWLDALEDGTIVVHDWDDAQFSASREIRNAWEATRKRTWRKTKAAPPSPDTAPSQVDSTSPSPHLTVTAPHSRTDMEGQRPDDVRTGEPRRNGADRTTCPRCGDLLDDKDPNVVVADHGRQLWHRACPATEATA
jgi:hypothetical protein